MSGALARSLAVLELLAEHPEGCSLSALATKANMPVSAAHRLLVELSQHGYVRQVRDHGDYMLTIKLVSLGLGFLSRAGIVDVAQPLLDQLATDSGELVRLAIVDGDDLTFVAKAQGAAPGGLRYDPDMGLSVTLSCSAAGHAWLSTMAENVALEMVAKQGFGMPTDFGPNAPTSVKALLPYLRRARQQGYSTIVEVFSPGMTAMAAPVKGPNGEVRGVVTIAGPLVRLTEARMAVLGPKLIATAVEVADISSVSPLFKNKAA
ncbi:MAG TPA: IclR family transcriptional regulator [Aliidongia sp.]|uniref:IclR family transcriptional regulator n=1 Tax=Aliidongia sp. TaxID=1914230 RepID=UPI002DDD0509|nr:IclR family transcriptional regulator [Aliidongia sp.]HEV2676941.1 IclR family transcriptional regulator [Aliidongia sp.]